MLSLRSADSTDRRECRRCVLRCRMSEVLQPARTRPVLRLPAGLAPAGGWTPGGLVPTLVVQTLVVEPAPAPGADAHAGLEHVGHGDPRVGVPVLHDTAIGPGGGRHGW